MPLKWCTGVTELAGPYEVINGFADVQLANSTGRSGRTCISLLFFSFLVFMLNFSLLTSMEYFFSVLQGQDQHCNSFMDASVR